MRDMLKTHSVMLLCKLAGVSRSGFYKWLRRQETESTKQSQDNLLKRLIKECHREVRGIYGYYRVRAWLRKRHGIIVNHKRVYRLMKELNVQAKIRRKKRFFGKVEHEVAPNHLKRQFEALMPNQKWATDVTYLQFNNQTLYLSAIYDMFNNEVVAYRIGQKNDLKLVLHTVHQANKKRDVTGVLLHSDQGFQYTSRQYKNLLNQYHITQSMSRKGNCLDNACIENFFGHLKAELMYINKFKTKAEVVQAVQAYIRFYNEDRIQRKLNDLSPIEYRDKVA
nr:IS3 family transposase [Tumebacillus sp. BK434]